MYGLERAKLKDRILELTIEQPTVGWGVGSIFKELNKPVKTKLELTEIIFEMIEEMPKFFDHWGEKDYELNITMNELTQDFLDSGGFGARCKEQQENENIALKEVERQKKKEWWKEARQSTLDYLKIIGLVVSIPISIFSLIVSLRNKEPDLTIIESKLNELETRINAIEIVPESTVTVSKDTLK